MTFNPQEDIQEALKDLLGGTIKEMMETEMDEHLGYQKSQRSDSEDYRNGYKRKRVNSRYGTVDIQVPQDRNSVLCIDAIHYSVRDNGVIRKLAAYIILGINMDG